mmetsp:Transcript_45250/g.145809  ORF Transcript_45250/g.145809 Transcript_45250/m.145809 type:complete len:330 (-) Transcript_45250:1142-2131(-)
MRKPRVLVLGGWSGGPLDYLRRRWSGECTFVEPPLHMPPQGARWCFTWEAALLAGAACLPWAVSAAGCGAAAALVTGAAVLCLAPRLVALLVRGAIRRSVAAAELCLKGGTVDLVVGFSWGGGVACWLLSERRWRGPTLLLAPTLEAMASAARLALPAPFFSARGGGGGARCCHDEADEADEAAGANQCPSLTWPRLPWRWRWLPWPWRALPWRRRLLPPPPPHPPSCRWKPPHAGRGAPRRRRRRRRRQRRRGRRRRRRARRKRPAQSSRPSARSGSKRAATYRPCGSRRGARRTRSPSRSSCRRRSTCAAGGCRPGGRQAPGPPRAR